MSPTDTTGTDTNNTTPITHARGKHRLTLSKALRHADSLAPPREPDLIYIPAAREVHAQSARALGTLAAEVRSLRRRLRVAQALAEQSATRGAP